MNFLPASATTEDGKIVLTGSGFRIELPEERAEKAIPDRVIVGVRPEDLDGPVSDSSNAVTMTASVKEQLGHALLVYGEVDGTQVVASLDPHRQVELDTEIHLKVNLDTVHAFDPDTLDTLI